MEKLRIEKPHIVVDTVLLASIDIEIGKMLLAIHYVNQHLKIRFYKDAEAHRREETKKYISNLPLSGC